MSNETNGTIIGIEIEVAKAEKKDKGRPIARLNSNTLEKLKIKAGNIVKITGKNRFTAAIAWPAFSEDQNKEKEKS